MNGEVRGCLMVASMFVLLLTVAAFGGWLVTR